MEDTEDKMEGVGRSGNMMSLYITGTELSAEGDDDDDNGGGG